jgi:hypothetical protein
MAYSVAKLRSSGDEESLYFISLRAGKVSDVYPYKLLILMLTEVCV